MTSTPVYPPAVDTCHLCEGSGIIVEMRRECCGDLDGGICRLVCMFETKETFSCENCGGTGKEPEPQ